MKDESHQTDNKPTTAFILVLLGGLWMLVSSVAMYGGMGRGMYNWGERSGRWAGSWMHNQNIICNFVHDYGWHWIGLLTAVVIFIAAVVIFARPEYRIGGAVAIIVASILGLFFGAGGFLAAALAITGAVLALAWQPEHCVTSQTNRTQ